MATSYAALVFPFSGTPYLWIKSKPKKDKDWLKLLQNKICHNAPKPWIEMNMSMLRMRGNNEQCVFFNKMMKHWEEKLNVGIVKLENIFLRTI